MAARVALGDVIESNHGLDYIAKYRAFYTSYSVGYLQREKLSALKGKPHKACRLGVLMCATRDLKLRVKQCVYKFCCAKRP